MELLITYDVETTSAAGQRRLRHVAKACEGSGHRVQQSVFEVVCDPKERLRLEATLLAIIDSDRDSIRIYELPRGTLNAARHLGAAVTPTHRGSIII